jgi:hypothetical protein
VRHVAHVPGDDEKNRGERSKRDIHGQRCKHQHDKDQCDGVHHAGERAIAAVTDVGCSARDRTGRGKPAEQRRGDVGQALADQFLIGIVTRSSHAVGNHRRQQRFDRAEHGDRKRRTDQLDHTRQRDFRKLQGRQAARDIAECTADGRHAVELKYRLQQGHADQCHQRSRHALEFGHLGGEYHQHQGEESQHGGGRMQLWERLQQRP